MMDVYAQQMADDTTEAVENEDIDSSEFPFDPSRIDITTQVTSVYNVVDQLRSGEIDLSPDFQRHPNLWKPGQQSRLIESLILGIPLPAFYFDVSIADDYSGDSLVGRMRRQVWHVVDGLQRLSAIRNFALEGTMKLRQMEYLKQLEGQTFSELPSQLQRRINAAPLSLYLIRPETSEEIKFNIFKRVNTGGLPLNQQEIRQAIFHGKGTSFVSKLASLLSFKEATQGRIPDRRMLDREFVNRFLAFYILDPAESYRSMDLFLNDAIRMLNKMSDERLADVEERFDSAMRLSHELLAENAFKRFEVESGAWAGKINKALFETFAVALARLSLVEQEKIRQIHNFPDRFKRLFRDDSLGGNFNSLIMISTGNRWKVLARHEQMRMFIKGCLGENDDNKD